MTIILFILAAVCLILSFFHFQRFNHKTKPLLISRTLPEQAKRHRDYHAFFGYLGAALIFFGTICYIFTGH